MKILITGKNSYIGNQFMDWVRKEPDFEVTSISLRGESWRQMDFSRYDTIIHLAGIVHKKEKEVSPEKYYEINRDLTGAVANKAKAEGVGQFVFFSTMAVYGERDSLEQKVVITGDTKEEPESDYGKSKLEGENKLKALESDTFKVAILRPPMVYGKDCPGNYDRLRKLSLHWGLYPNIRNQRSMIYVENLLAALKGIIEYNKQGYFFPQDVEYVETLDMIKEIRRVYQKKTVVINLVKPVMRLLGKKSSVIKKVFGNLCYEQSLSKLSDIDYQKVSMKEGIRKIEIMNNDYK